MLLLSQLARKVSLSGFLFLSIASVFQLKPEQPINVPEQPPVSFITAVLRLVVVVGIISLPFFFLFRWIKKSQERGRSPIIKEDATQNLILTGDENFIGSLHEGFEIIFNILQICNTIGDEEGKKAFLKECHSNFLFYGPPGAGKNHAVEWLKHLLDKEKIDIPFVIVKEVETSFIGGGANTLNHVFNKLAEQAKKSKNKVAICVFDELTSVVPDRSIEYGSNKTSDQLLKLTDGFEKKEGVTILLIGLTNHLTKVDSAFISRSCCFVFNYDKKILGAILKKHFDEEFLSECKTLRTCLENDYLFAPSKKPLSPRDLLNIKKTMFQHTLKNRNKYYDNEGLLNFDVIKNKALLFDECYELNKSSESPILCQKF